MAMVATKADLVSTTTVAGVPGLSAEQFAIALYVKNAKGNLVVRARAGTGKTYLIRKCLPLMYGNKAIAAFNRKIAKEVREKVAEDGVRGVDIATFNSFGARVLRERFKTIRLDGYGKGNAGFNKFSVIAERLEIPKNLQPIVRKAVDRAQERLFGVENPRTGRPFISNTDKQAWLDLASHYDFSDMLPDASSIEVQLLRIEKQLSEEEALDELLLTALRYAAKALQLSVKMASEEFVGPDGKAFTGVVTFAEQLYLPLYLKLPLPQYNWVCVDEAQDSNPARREFASRMLKPKVGRIMLVGDDRQAIYGFAGADNDALDLCIRQFNAKVFPMTVTFRCAKSVVALAQRLVPDYRAADTNIQGTTRSIKECELDKVEFAFNGKVVKATDGSNITNDMIICRNTAPLVKVAYKLIGRGVAAHVEGKDIGKDLIRLINRWPHVKTLPILDREMTKWLEAETTKLNLKGHEAQAEALSDQVETVQVIAKGLKRGAKVAQLVEKIDELFKDTPDGERAKTVTLISAHRSKGLEADRVFGLGVEKFMPSKYAKTEWQLGQENNLLYVLITRSMKEYVEVIVA
jgi:superfamily I DNA/RNA helicase